MAHAERRLTNLQLVGDERELPPQELFEKLQPFKELVAEDIEEGG